MRAAPGRHTWSVTFLQLIDNSGGLRGWQCRETNRSVGWQNRRGARIIRFVLWGFRVE
jgi:hypothetical protein